MTREILTKLRHSLIYGGVYDTCLVDELCDLALYGLQCKEREVRFANQMSLCPPDKSDLSAECGPHSPGGTGL